MFSLMLPLKKCFCLFYIKKRRRWKAQKGKKKKRTKYIYMIPLFVPSVLSQRNVVESELLHSLFWIEVLVRCFY